MTFLLQQIFCTFSQPLLSEGGSTISNCDFGMALRELMRVYICAYKE